MSFNLQSANLWSAVYSLRSVVCSLQSAVCDLQSANVIHRVDTGAIAFETAKIAYITGATENKQLVQEARFSF